MVQMVNVPVYGYQQIPAGMVQQQPYRVSIIYECNKFKIDVIRNEWYTVILRREIYKIIRIPNLN